MPDTGASQTIVSSDVAGDAKLVVHPTLTELRNASNSKVILCNNKHSVSSTVLDASHFNHATLISWQDLQKLHIIPKTFPAVTAVACVYNNIKTIAAFSSVFSDTLDNKPMFAQQMKIYLKDHSVPYRVSAPSPIPLCFQEPANRCLLYTSPSPRDRQKSRMPSSA